MTSKDFRISISSPPDREHLVAEVFVRDPAVGWAQWAELNQEQGAVTLELYPRPDGKPWVLDFNEGLKVLGEAKRRLTGS